MRIEKFLDRIQFQGEISLTFDCLSELQKQFIKTVPFENIDIIKKQSIDYSSKAVYRKVVEFNRGGVCYENNSLFYWALKEIGFDVVIIEAEMFPEGNVRNKFDHMALVVNLDGALYLVDVGNGKYFGSPLDVNGDSESDGEGIRYKIMHHNDDLLALCWLEGEEWKIRYVFHLGKKKLSDFKEACLFTETSNESAFTKKVLATLLCEKYRVTLSGNSLSKTYDDQNKKNVVIPDQDIDKILRDIFGIATST